MTDVVIERACGLHGVAFVAEGTAVRGVDF